MRHRPIQTAPPERVPFTLWGTKRVRRVLATATAAAIGLVPVVMVPSPAWAAPIDFLTISNAEGWEGGKLVFNLTYTGTTAASFDFGLINGTATLADNDYAALAPGDSPSFVAASSPPQIDFPISSSGAPTKATISLAIPTTGAAEAATETFTLRAVADGATIATAVSPDKVDATGSIWNLDATNDIILTAPVDTEVETAVGGMQKKVTVTAKQKNPQQHDVIIPVNTGTADLDSDGVPDPSPDYTAAYATSEGNANRDFTALASDAKIVIPANETSGSITVDLWDDTSDETDIQYFRVQEDTSRPTLGGVVLAGQDAAQFAIKDDDAEPKISLWDATTVKEGAPLTFPIALTNPSEKVVTASLTAVGVATGSAKAATVG
ncbi:MAG TPA: hypothetical protein VN408_39260, partial [Actinoplanes sp.]|nr:hypothetical protein [Actinoplanes sp.]